MKDGEEEEKEGATKKKKKKKKTVTYVSEKQNLVDHPIVFEANL